MKVMTEKEFLRAQLARLEEASPAAHARMREVVDAGSKAGAGMSGNFSGMVIIQARLAWEKLQKADDSTPYWRVEFERNGELRPVLIDENGNMFVVPGEVSCLPLVKTGAWAREVHNDVVHIVDHGKENIVVPEEGDLNGSGAAYVLLADGRTVCCTLVHRDAKKFPGSGDWNVMYRF